MSNHKVIIAVFALFSCFISQNVHSDILLLVHGYQSSGHEWRARGVVNRLHSQGWYDAGHFTRGPQGVIGPTVRGDQPSNIVYTLDLPYEAPVLAQVSALDEYLQSVRRMAADEKVILAGHSAGGVVARATMVLHPEHRVSELITIASPHRGTEAAYFASALSRSAVGDVADWLGFDSIPRSARFFTDLKPDDPGTFLFWLNHQAHPWANYVSIVRAENRFTGGDALIPKISQDMRYVAAIGARAKLVTTVGDHELKAQDGMMIANILNYGL
jgi:pimeloyl-ACP methyl ester carboxylesterase